MLINQKVEAKQLDNCDLTFRDISKIKSAFVNLLTGYYHNRIKYQNQQDPDDAPAKTEEQKAETAKEPVKAAVKEAPKEGVKSGAQVKGSTVKETAAAKTTKTLKEVKEIKEKK